MADNLLITTGSGTSIATDDVGGVHYQRVKQDYGVDGSAADGGSAYKNLDLGTVGQVLKNTAGRLLRLVIANRHATLERFVKVYNKATAADSTDVPIMTIPVRPITTIELNLGEAGAKCALGIGLRGTTGIADNDNTAPTANDVVVNATFV